MKGKIIRLMEMQSYNIFYYNQENVELIIKIVILDSIDYIIIICCGCALSMNGLWCGNSISLYRWCRVFHYQHRINQ